MSVHWVKVDPERTLLALEASYSWTGVAAGARGADSRAMASAHRVCEVLRNMGERGQQMSKSASSCQLVPKTNSRIVPLASPLAPMEELGWHPQAIVLLLAKL